MRVNRVLTVAVGSLLLSLCLSPQALPQISKLDRDRAQGILDVVGNEIRKHYYDPKLHGVDWDAQLTQAHHKIADAKSFNMAMSHIAAALNSLDDSHTFFLPPVRPYRIDFGWEYQMIGDRCFVTHVRPGSDAEAKGVKPGDAVLSVNGFTPDRDNQWTMHYVFTVLRPQPTLRLTLQDPAGGQRQVEVATKIRETSKVKDFSVDMWNIIRDEESEAHRMRSRSVEYGDELLVLRIPGFFYTPTEVGDMIGKARKHKALIIDLRGDGGGSVDTLAFLVGGIFGRELKIADRVGRKENKPQLAKGFHEPYAGRVIVLVDSDSASAAEVFARVIQLEKRGVIMGDRTAGAVMEAKHYNEQMGGDFIVYYGISITDADVVMSDGKSLEHIGVTPDEPLLPSASDIASGRDPVLAHAAQSAGVKLSPEEAGKLFPYEWPEQFF